MKLECAFDYDQNVGVIVIGDLVMIQYTAFRKTIKRYHKLFFVYVDMAVFNASILFLKTSGKKLSLLEFKSQIIEIDAGQKSGNVLTSPVSHPLRFTGRHFPSLYIGKTGGGSEIS